MFRSLSAIIFWHNSCVFVFFSHVFCSAEVSVTPRTGESVTPRTGEIESFAEGISRAKLSVLIFFSDNFVLSGITGLYLIPSVLVKEIKRVLSSSVRDSCKNSVRLDLSPVSTLNIAHTLSNFSISAIAAALISIVTITPNSPPVVNP